MFKVKYTDREETNEEEIERFLDAIIRAVELAIVLGLKNVTLYKGDEIIKRSEWITWLRVLSNRVMKNGSF